MSGMDREGTWILTTDCHKTLPRENLVYWQTDWWRDLEAIPRSGSPIPCRLWEMPSLRQRDRENHPAG